MKKYVVPYLIDSTKNGKMKSRDGAHQRAMEHDETKHSVAEIEETLPSKMVLDGSYSYYWPSSVKSFVGELLGFAEDES